MTRQKITIIDSLGGKHIFGADGAPGSFKVERNIETSAATIFMFNAPDHQGDIVAQFFNPAGYVIEVVDD